jgi:hypothetical protein
MKLRKITLTILSFTLIFLSCKTDEGTTIPSIPDRDRTEVYLEDIAEIEEFLATHFYNYEDFDFTDPYTPANDAFQIAFHEIDDDNLDKTPLIDQVDFKIVEDGEGVEYKLYFLNVREGLGETLYPSDEAFLNYKGMAVTSQEIFDSTVNPISLNLISVSTVSPAIVGVVNGFREGLIEFKTSTGFTDNGDGTNTYHNHGIGAIFIPSGLGYFSSALSTGVPAYTPIMFTVRLMQNIHTDFDLDNVPSYLEDLDLDNDVFTDDTDADLLANFIDNDDDGDGVFTIYEDLEPDEDLMVDRDNDGDPTNDIGDGDPTNDDTDNDGVPNYLDIDDTGSNQEDADGDGIPDYLDN